MIWSGKTAEREMLNVFLTQFCENMSAAKRLLGSWKMILQIYSRFYLLAQEVDEQIEEV